MKIQNKERFNDLPQRQKKFAKTKITLLNALIEELQTKELSSIMIKELVKKAEISEPTFFNYFESKQHMLLYLIQLWSIQMQDIAREAEEQSRSYIEAIKKIFLQTAKDLSQHPQIMLEIIAFQTSNMILTPHTISDGEKWLFFEDIKDVEKLEGVGIESIFPPLLDKAKKAGELDETCDTQLLFLILSSLFFGTSLMILKQNPQALPGFFEAELNILFEKLSQ